MANELAGSSVNLNLTESDDGLRGFMEVILVCTEPRYSLDFGGQIARSRVAENIRFYANVKSLRELVKAFSRYADDLEKLEQTAATFSQAKQSP